MPASEHVHSNAVRLWLVAVAALIFLTLIVGGATRLTESGLSITEWRPVTGALPPMSENAWQGEFARYREIPQYRELNRGMTLEQFKTIYWWEWSHRFLARTVGAAFLLPFLFFLWRGMIPRELRLRLWTIFLGGAALGMVGWWMVSSGLVGSARTSVSQYRLAFHLTLACAIYAAIVWTAQQMRAGTQADVASRVRRTALALAVLLVLQIYLGALVAGLDAGMNFNTWPLIDSTLIPAADRLWFETPWWRNLFENALAVQFNHRMVAYAIWLLAIWHAFDARHSAVFRSALSLAILVTLQAVLGIMTLIYATPLGLALAHQGMAVMVLTAAVLHAERLRRGEAASAMAMPQGART
jgi:heme a synthase